MPNLKFYDLWNRSNRSNVVVSQTVARVDFQPATRSKFGTLTKLKEMLIRLLPISRQKRIAISPGMKFDVRRLEPRSRFDLLCFRRDKQRDTNAGVKKRRTIVIAGLPTPPSSSRP